MAGVPIGAQDFRIISLAQLGEFCLQIAPKHDIGTAPGHVGSNGHCPWPTRLGHDFRFLFVKLGVQHLMGNLALL